MTIYLFTPHPQRTSIIVFLSVEYIELKPQFGKGN